MYNVGADIEIGDRLRCITDRNFYTKSLTVGKVYEVLDISRDKQYVTIIPNEILNYSRREADFPIELFDIKSITRTRIIEEILDDDTL